MAEFFQDRDDDQDNKSPELNKKIDTKTKSMAGVAGVLVLGVAVLGWQLVARSAENERKLKDTALENLLRGRGFNDAGIGIEVSGGGEKLRVSCNPPDPITGEIVSGEAISFYINPNGDATLPLIDADGQDLGTENMQVFPLATEEDIIDFTDGFVSETCAVISQS